MLIGIDDAENGLKCNCICYSCGGKLIARKGDERQHHFAHHKNSIKDCKYSFWVVCRDLVEQLFIPNKKDFLKKINLPDEYRYNTITKVSTRHLTVANNKFDIYIQTRENGPIYVRYITPEAHRIQEEYMLDTESLSHPMTILEINLTNAYEHRGAITEYLKEIIIDSTSKKHIIRKFPLKHEISKTPYEYNLFSSEFKDKEESKKIIPNISKFSSSRFKKELLLFDIKSFDKKDIIAIDELAIYYKKNIEKYAFDENKSHIYNIISYDYPHGMISVQEDFFGMIKISNEYIVYIEKNGYFTPIVASPFLDNIKAKLLRVLNNRYFVKMGTI
jgi:hypothetical protein